MTTAASLLHRGGFLPEMLPIAVLWAAIMILMACGFRPSTARKLRRLKRERADALSNYVLGCHPWAQRRRARESKDPMATAWKRHG